MTVVKAIANTGSRRISQNNGMRLIAAQQIDCIAGRLPGEVWSITAEEWRRHRASTK
jgi:hypothetical protein